MKNKTIKSLISLFILALSVSSVSAYTLSRADFETEVKNKLQFKHKNKLKNLVAEKLKSEF